MPIRSRRGSRALSEPVSGSAADRTASAAEVEAAFYGSEGIAEAAVLGVPDERLGEVPVAILYRREGSSISEEELRAFLEGRLAAFKIPARMIFSDDPLPRLGTGKIDRLALKQLYAA